MEALSTETVAGGRKAMARSFQDLPDEMVSHVFSFLDIIDITNSSIVCKQWQRASRSAALQKAVIIDVQKWAAYVPRPPSADTIIFRRHFYPGFPSMPDQFSGQRKSLLARFITGRTRQLIVRWPLGSLPPAPEMIEDPADVSLMAFYYNFYYDLPQIGDHLREILKDYVPQVLKNGDIGKLVLTLQNLQLSLDILSGIMPRD
ncbi:uncharacterized protein LOC129589748 [Paramacrobiotus metropolitanus]|uniref:uncharacterized protein LOC129589748 n=1 Tax=Paramacrobiotus metropolitanus TaxID=2943436 RepID=UPI00244562F8|nr:uncharacterized protein LOC129589748 [Paramacrobiotus metropolitanus]